LPPLAQIAVPGADQRSVEILDRVRLAFAQKGFDGASMQDLARAAGMSVGNFYRYFPSKSAIIEALIARDMHEIEQDFHAITRSSDARAALREVIVRRVSSTPCPRDSAIMAEITAAAFRKPEIAAIARRMEDSVTEYMTATFARITGIPPDDCARRFEGHARLIIMLVKATLCDTGHTEGARADLTDLVLRNIDRTLDDVVADVSRG
jgi:AcrR family transcriptional regulator